MNLEDAKQRIKELEAENSKLKSELGRKMAAPFGSVSDGERRQYMRAKTHFLLAYRQYTDDPAKPEEPWQNSHVENISLGGFKFDSSKEYEVGAIIEIKLTMPEGVGTIKACAEVRRSEAISKEQFSVGAKFANITGYHKAIIEDAIIQEKEKRRSRRFRMGYPFLFTRLPDGDKERGYIKNISRHGLGFLTSCNLQLGAEIKVEVYLSDQVFKIVGQVSRCAESGTYQLYDVGVDFGESVDEFKQKLEEKLRNLYHRP